jgi:hypothetical protein
VTWRPTDQMVLRIRNALGAKEQAYRKYLESGAVRTDDVLAIAINVHAVPNACADMGDLMMRSFFGVGDLVVRLDRETGEVLGTYHAQFAHITKKKTGATVEVQKFIDGSLPHIAAVLGSRADAVNLPRRLGDDLTVFPNFTARVRWPAGMIRLGEEWLFTQGNEGWDVKLASYVCS